MGQRGVRRRRGHYVDCAMALGTPCSSGSCVLGCHKVHTGVNTGGTGRVVPVELSRLDRNRERAVLGAFVGLYSGSPRSPNYVLSGSTVLQPCHHTIGDSSCFLVASCKEAGVYVCWRKRVCSHCLVHESSAPPNRQPGCSINRGEILSLASYHPCCCLERMRMFVQVDGLQDRRLDR